MLEDKERQLNQKIKNLNSKLKAEQDEVRMCIANGSRAVEFHWYAYVRVGKKTESEHAVQRNSEESRK